MTCLHVITRMIYNENNLSNTWTETEDVEFMLLDEQRDGEFQTYIAGTEDTKFVEDSFSIGLLVFFPFLIAGFGTVSAGILFDAVTVKFSFLMPD